MIKEITIYEANGVRFDDLNSAIKYEDLCDEIECIMSRLEPRTEEIEDALDYGKQNIKVVESCIKDLCMLCAKIFPDYKQLFIEVANGDRHISHIGRLLDDTHEYPILRETYFRFDCIDMKTGYEFQQPYFANHVDEALREIKKNQEYFKQHGSL